MSPRHLQNKTLKIKFVVMTIKITIIQLTYVIQFVTYVLVYTPNMFTIGQIANGDFKETKI